jgi:hypothetical protein
MGHFTRSSHRMVFCVKTGAPMWGCYSNLHGGTLDIRTIIFQRYNAKKIHHGARRFSLGTIPNLIYLTEI